MSECKDKVAVFGGQFLYKKFPELEELLKGQFEVITEQELLEDVSQGVHIKVVLLVQRSAASILEYHEKGILPNLQLLCKAGVGIAHLPLAEIKSRGIRLANTAEVMSDPAADMAMGLVLASGRQLRLGKR